ncbi:MAG: Gfo/Idh/MocA family oxidoreductase [Proteobacteria bacterium]|nr:Gfo/Idh/MocA family oxidoreductase [Pseudomonadota bacterium]
MPNSQVLSRRALFRRAAGITAGVGVASTSCALPRKPSPSTSAPATRLEHPPVLDMPFEPRSEVRLGMVGVGARGMGLLRDFLAVDAVKVTAVCDTVQDKTSAAQNLVAQAGQEPPAVYARGERDFERLANRDDVDLVVVATPWRWHVPMAVDAMNKGKHVGLEVPAATSVEECWQLVDVSEKTRRHCVMLENCCYGSDELMVLGMVRDGLLGQLTHGEAAYIHDLRELLFRDESEGLWRRFAHTRRDANLYPTHGLGPVASYMNINRGDRFEYLVSVSSPQLGLEAYRGKHVPEKSPKWKERYVCGDINSSLIKTARGRSILLQHDVVSPRPYDRLNLVSGTGGTFAGYPSRIYIDGQKEHAWQSPEPFKKRYLHPLWRRVGDLARKAGGHGGMDLIMCYRLIECMREGLVPDMDVYDAASWSVPTTLSQVSVAGGGTPASFPDFTRGRWDNTRRPFAAQH